MTLSTLSKSKEEDGVVRGLGEASDAAFAVPGVTPCFSFESSFLKGSRQPATTKTHW